VYLERVQQAAEAATRREMTILSNRSGLPLSPIIADHPGRSRPDKRVLLPDATEHGWAASYGHLHRRRTV
jgi:hypothetical protein